MPEEPYAPAVEYLELFSRAMWEKLRPALSAVLRGVDPKAGLIVDEGAGTGRGTEVILESVPGVHVLALEPSAGLRAVLLARVVGSRPHPPGHGAAGGRGQRAAA